MFRKILLAWAMGALAVLCACNGPTSPAKPASVRAVRITYPVDGQGFFNDEFSHVTFQPSGMDGHYMAEPSFSMDGGRSFESEPAEMDATSIYWGHLQRFTGETFNYSLVVRITLRDSRGEVSDRVTVRVTSLRNGVRPPRHPQEHD